jgi:hypothetical protein
MQLYTIPGRERFLSKLYAAILLLAINLTPVSPVFASFGDGTPTIPNPNVFTESDAPKIDGASGAFTQRIPLDIPPGRNGLQPDVTLDYNSQCTQDSMVGYGWQLSIPYIQRLNKIGSQNLYSSSPYFTSSFDGELANTSTTTSAMASSTLTNNLTAYWKMDESSGNASDATGNGYTLTNNNSVWFAAAKINNGAVFASANSKNFSKSSVSGLVPSSTLTVSAWVYLSSNNGEAIVSKGNVGTYSGPYIFAINVTNGLSFYSSNGSNAGWVGVNWTPSLNTWYHVAVTFNAGSVAFYVNGVQQGTTQSAVVSSLNQSDTNSFFVGAYSTNGGTANAAFFDGKMDEMGVWSRALSSSEICQLYNSGSGLSYPMSLATSSTAATITFLARIDDGSSRQYTYSTSTNSWVMYDKRGTRYTFGSNDTGRQYDTSTGTSTNTYKWYLQDIRDTNGNYIKYTYTRDNNEIYPSQIIYTGNGANDEPAVVSFVTSTRPDMRISFLPGFKVTTNYRISEIDASFNSQTVRKYLLSYGPGINGVRSMLTSVQQQGYDDSNNLVSLPATTFTYASSSTMFSTPGSGFTIDGQSWIVADTNGNGINDANLFYNANSQQPNQEYIYPDASSQGIYGYNPPEYWANGAQTNTPPQERGTRYVDVNGDGKPDLVRGYYNYTNSTSAKTLYLNTYSTSTSYGWTATTTWTGDLPLFDYDGSGSIHNLTTGIFGDVNGDGLPDFEQRIDGLGFFTGVFLGNGSAWDATSTSFSPVQSMPVFNPTVYGSQLIDVNGDGLDDWIYSDGTKTYVALNTGTGWEGPEPQWTISTSTLFATSNGQDNFYLDRGIRFMDINGDGLPNLVRAYKVAPYTACIRVPALPQYEVGDVKWVLLNTGNGWATSTAYSLPAYITLGNVPSNGDCWSGGFSYNEYANWTANGQLLQDVITHVTYPKGGSTSVLYGYSAPTGTNPELPISLLVTSEIGLYDGMGHAATTTYQYAGGKLYLASGVRDRKFAGFASSIATLPDSIVKTYFDQGDGTSTALGEQSDGYAQVNQPFRKDVYDLSSNLIQSNFYRWDSFNRGNNAYLLNIGRQVEQDYAADGTHRDKATDYTYSTTTGDLLTQIDYGEVTGNSDGTFTDTGSDKRTTLLTYAASSSVNLSVVTEKKLLDSASSTVSDQKLYYDSLPFGQVSLGNNTRQEDWIGGATFASSTKTYNSYGLVATSTDRRGYATGYTYDAFNLYVATATNPLNQKTQYLYNYGNGKPKLVTDPNNRLIKNLYDGVGRLTEVDQSDTANPSLLATSTTYQYTDNSTPPSVIRRTDYFTATNTVDTFSYYDGLNRLLQERKSSQTAGTYTATDRLYNSAGLLSSQSAPYFSSGSSYTSPTSSTRSFPSYFAPTTAIS